MYTSLMESQDKFINCQNPVAVHNELRVLLCCDFLNKESSNQRFQKFKLRCRNHLTTPTEQNLDNPSDILDRLEQKGLFGLNNYAVLKDLVKDDKCDVLELIEEAEEKLLFIRGETDAPRKKGRRKRIREDENIKKLRQRLLKINRHETEVIPVSPLQEKYKLPLEKLYASVVIREDLSYNSRERGAFEDDTSNTEKEVKSPDDIFTRNGEPTKHIYMQGDAARGKTTYCLWLLKHWCDAIEIGECDDEWRKALGNFDFVFFIPMRFVHPSRVAVTEMICKDVLQDDPDLHETVLHVSSSDRYHSLIILDGLDEWNRNKKAAKHLKHKTLPKIDISDCVVCTTMRPWMLDRVSERVRNNDIVVEMKGLDKEGIKFLITNLLINHFRFIPDSDNFKRTYNGVIEKTDKLSLKSCMQIPLLVVFCVQIWVKQEKVGSSMTSLYTAMISMLIERASKKYELKRISKKIPKDARIPNILLKYMKIKQYIPTLLDLGKIAFEGLVSTEKKLVFQKDVLQDRIGEKELQFALHVGLISQREDSSYSGTTNIRIEFFHKSIQEYLAAFSIAADEKASRSFFEHLANLVTIMDLSDVIMFVCGMCPSLGSSISQHVLTIIDKDNDVRKYRENDELFSAVLEMNKLQGRWYREIVYEPTGNTVTFYVSDISLDRKCDTETVMVTRQSLSKHHPGIKSLYFDMIPTEGERGITDKEFNAFLSRPGNSNSLSKLYLNGFNTDRSVYEIYGPSLNTLVICAVKVDSSKDAQRAHLSSFLRDVQQLRSLELNGINLVNRDLGISATMENIQFIKLQHVKMSLDGWVKFRENITEIKHAFSIELRNTNIDDGFVRKIRYARYFKITSFGHDDHICFDKLDRYTVFQSSDSHEVGVYQPFSEDEEEEERSCFRYLCWWPCCSCCRKKRNISRYWKSYGLQNHLSWSADTDL